MSDSAASGPRSPPDRSSPTWPTIRQTPCAPISEPPVAAQVAMPILFQSSHSRSLFGMTESAEATAASSGARSLLAVRDVEVELPAGTAEVAAPAASRRISTASVRSISLSSSRRRSSQAAACFLRCQLPGQRIGCTTDLLVPSPPTSLAASARASLSSSCSAFVAVGFFSRQCRCTLGSISPVAGLVHSPPLSTTAVAVPSRASSVERAACGL